MIVAVASGPPCLEPKARKKEFGLETEPTSEFRSVRWNWVSSVPASGAALGCVLPPHQ